MPWTWEFFPFWQKNYNWYDMITLIITFEMWPGGELVTEEINVTQVMVDFWKTMLVVSGCHVALFIQKLVWGPHRCWWFVEKTASVLLYIVAGPAGSFPNPSEGVLISEITFEANIEPEDRFPGYGLYKVAPKRRKKTFKGSPRNKFLVKVGNLAQPAWPPRPPRAYVGIPPKKEEKKHVYFAF